jgi:hypothetical protein
MRDNKLYSIVTQADADAPSARVEPSEFFLQLSPQEAVDQLSSHIKSLEDRLADFAKVDLKVPEDFNRAREVSFELELAQDFLRRFKNDCGISD